MPIRTRAAPARRSRPLRRLTRASYLPTVCVTSNGRTTSWRRVSRAKNVSSGRRLTVIFAGSRRDDHGAATEVLPASDGEGRMNLQCDCLLPVNDQLAVV